jgi:hypothetical protein
MMNRDRAATGIWPEGTLFKAALVPLVGIERSEPPDYRPDDEMEGCI